MRLLAFLVGCTPFLALEASLRLFGDPPVVQEGVDHDPVVDLHQLRRLFVLSEDKTQWEIPSERYNFFRPESFPATKSENVRRIFVLGGSTVQGRPYAIETAFSSWLELRLQSADPRHQYEVINCGGVSYASYRVAKILQEVLQHDPDAIVLYTGHNEFLEDRSYQHIRELGKTRSVISRWGSRMRTVQWMKTHLANAHAKTAIHSEVNARLDHPGGLESYRRDPDWRTKVEKHFRFKLNQMIALTREADVPLVLCVPASDIVNTAPIKVQTCDSLSEKQHQTFQSNYAIATDTERPSDERLDAAQVCIGLDESHAGVNYILGRLHMEQGNAIGSTLIVARDHDVCPLRATSHVVESVRLLAKEHAVPLVDTELLLDERSLRGERIPDGIPDPEYFIDHLHPTIAGHQKIGYAIATKMVTEIPSFQDVQHMEDSQQAYEKAAVVHLETLGESYYARGKQRLEGLKNWMSGQAGQPPAH